MGTLIDGRTHETVRIDSLGRMQTFATRQTEFQEAIKDGRAFLVATDLITLTSANETAIFYIKNNETTPLIIHDFFVQAGTSTGGTSPDIIRKDYFGATGGTLISNAVAAATANLNAASTETLSVSAFKGVEGDTLTGQVATAQGFFFAASNFLQSTGFIMPPAGTIAVSATPPPSNTSLKIAVILNVYKQLVLS